MGYLQLVFVMFSFITVTVFLLIYSWIFPFGNVREVIQRKNQIFQPYCDSYFEYKDLPFVGLYCFHIPVLSINDPDIAKHVLIKDFDYFQSHGIYSSSKVSDPLGGHLFNIHGPKWTSLRAKLSPVFTPSKLKSFYPFVEKVANQALEYSDSMFASQKSINFIDLYGKYAVEIIGNIGFGIEINGFKKTENEFHKRCYEFFEYTSKYWTIMRGIAFFAPEFFKKLRVSRTDPAINKFFYNQVKLAVDYREKNNYRRNDFLQTLIELMKKDSKAGTDKSDAFTFIDVASNTMLYMFAGYETSATTGRFAAYELACNPHVQAKAREEVHRVLAKYGGQCTFEAQNEMTYLNMVIDETMRKYPPLRALFRRCNKDYQVPGHNLVIEKGTLIFIPIHAIHMDPDIFEDPEKFDPERFAPERKAKLHPCHWMPFGEGPRKCLGLKQGYIQAKTALIKILSKYELILDDRTERPIRIKPSSFSCASQGGIWIKLKKLDNEY